VYQKDPKSTREPHLQVDHVVPNSPIQRPRHTLACLASHRSSLDEWTPCHVPTTPTATRGEASTSGRGRTSEPKTKKTGKRWRMLDTMKFCRLECVFFKAANGKTIMTSHNFSGHDWKECPVCYFRGHCGDMLAFLSNECLFEECKSHESQW